MTTPVPRRPTVQPVPAKAQLRAIPAVRSADGLATDLWPRTARLEAGGDISVGGVPLSTLAAQYGTPAYILDEADVRGRCRTYADALPGAEIAYAAKAFWCRAMAGWIAREGLSLDVCSAGELAVAGSLALPIGRRPSGERAGLAFISDASPTPGNHHDARIDEGPPAGVRSALDAPGSAVHPVR